MREWRVTYEDFFDRKNRVPFFKREEIVEAATRKEAIEKVKANLLANYCYNRFDRFKASVIKKNN